MGAEPGGDERLPQKTKEEDAGSRLREACQDSARRPVNPHAGHNHLPQRPRERNRPEDLAWIFQTNMLYLYKN
jgi:hypothetical protein